MLMETGNITHELVTLLMVTANITHGKIDFFKKSVPWVPQSLFTWISRSSW